MNKDTFAMLNRLTAVGISTEDAYALRRISMTLHRWHELECGDGNWYIERIPVTKRRIRQLSSPACSPQYQVTIPAGARCKQVDNDWVVEETAKVRGSNAHDLEHYYVFIKADEIIERPYMCSQNFDSRSPTADRETGARKRLAKIMARYPTLQAYVQTDPRGCALYILRPDDVPEGSTAECYYNRGVAVYQ